MGGGPPNADVVRSSCILTFPEETMAEPVPVDAWYLHAVGLTFLRRLARDRVGDDMKISLLMQQLADEETSDSATSMEEQEQQERVKRYIAVSSDDILKRALQETFDHPEKALVLHIISLEKVLGLKSIHVRPEINPNVSPEPVAPMGLVFPTLHVEDALPQVTPVPMAMSISYSMRKSVFEPPKQLDDDGMKPMGNVKALSQSANFIEEREYTWTGGAQQQQEAQPSVQQQQPSSETTSESVTPQSQVQPSIAKQIDVDDEVDVSSIPMARVVGDSSFDGAQQIASEYVMLELQHGAGLPTEAASSDANSSVASSTYFISSMWHVQADEMSASMRLERPSPPPPATAAVPVTIAAPAGNWRRQQREEDGETRRGSRREDRAFPVAASLEESFVMLEHN
ncbi:hypothetical protein FI667_g12300, partial [Globisporangium splendens]